MKKVTASLVSALALSMLAIFLAMGCTKEVVKEVEVPGDTIVVEKEVVREVEVEKIVTVEKIVVATPTPPPAGAPQFGGTLRIVSQSSIGALDPVFNGLYTVQAIASHIYETPFGWNGNLETKPRVVDTWSLTNDGLEYTFTLRDMTFHDGSPLEAEDVARSLYRWRDGPTAHASLIRRLTDDYDEAITIVGDKTFKLRMKSPLGSVPFLMSIPFGNAIVRAEDAATPLSEPVQNRIGTAAYKFVRWDPGDRVVLERYDGYVPRLERGGPDFAPGANTGATNAYLDALIWLEIPDEETKVAGLETGEWDVIDSAGFDFFERLDANPDLQVVLYKPGMRSNVQLNPSIPPFRYQKARQALQAGVDVEDYMHALGPKDLWDLCPALYWCGNPLETDAGSRYTVTLDDGTEVEIGYDVNNIDVARQLLAESDYAGETTVVLNPTDYGTITPLGPVLIQDMQEIGFVVEMLAYDWATITTMFSNTGSYSANTSWYSHWCCGNPAQDHFLSGTYDYIIRDEGLTSLQLAWSTETDENKRFEIVEEINRLRWRKVTDLTLGVWFPLMPARADLQFFEVKSVPFFGNTWLKN